jgi:hypothetical protein
LVDQAFTDASATVPGFHDEPGQFDLVLVGVVPDLAVADRLTVGVDQQPRLDIDPFPPPPDGRGGEGLHGLRHPPPSFVDRTGPSGHDLRVLRRGSLHPPLGLWFPRDRGGFLMPLLG